MKLLFQETLARFPEVDLLIDSEDDSPYIYFSYISGWIENLASEEVTQSICDRIASFGEWCCQLPQGKDASDNPATLLMLGLYESLAFSENGRKVMANIWDENYVISSESYLRQWIGDVEYEALLNEYQTS